MVNITVKELAEHFTKLLKKNKQIDLGAKIYAAAVVGEGDPEFPPGTILFDCKSLGSDEPDHILSIYPTKLGKLQ
jgi:hypothetical protein